MRRGTPGIWPLLAVVTVGVTAAIAVDLDATKKLIVSAELRAGIKAIALLLSAGSGVFSYVRAEHRHHDSSLRQERRDAMARLEDTLASSVQNLFVGERPETIRANVMVVSKEELSMLASVNMLVFPDYKVRLRIGQGCAGVAWQQALDATVSDFWKPVVAASTDLTAGLKKVKWRLTEDQILLTRHILWVVSIPLFRKSQGQRTFLGVLNFDGVHRALKHPERLSQSDFMGQCAAIGERVAELVASQESGLAGAG